MPAVKHQTAYFDFSSFLFSKNNTIKHVKTSVKGLLWEQFDTLIIYSYNSSVSWNHFYSCNNYLTAGPYGFCYLDTGSGGSPLYKPCRYVQPLRVCFFAPFGSGNGYTFCPFWSGIQLNKKETVIYEYEVFLWKSFIWRSNLSNDDINS